MDEPRVPVRHSLGRWKYGGLRAVLTDVYCSLTEVHCGPTYAQCQPSSHITALLTGERIKRFF